MDTPIYVLFVLFLTSQGNGELSTASRNQEIVVGEGVRLNCSTPDKNIIWKHIPIGSWTENDVYVDGKIIQPYDQRFRVERNVVTGSYSLVISSVQREDSGTYICMGADGKGQKDKSELTVLETVKPQDVKPVPMHASKKVVIIVVCVVVGVVVVSSIGIAFACAYRMLLSSSDPCPTIRYLWKVSTDDSMVTGVAILKDSMVTGVAILKDSLYIVHSGQKMITVYQATSPCLILGKITLEGLQDPRDVAACSKNSCLYISDAGHGCVWRVEVGAVMTTRDTKISAWVAKVGEPYTLAVISGGRVLMVQRPNTMRIYRADGTMFRTFQIRGNISEPQHAVRTSRGTFIVSHGGEHDMEHKVSEVSAKGEILKSFGNRRDETDAPCEETGLRLIRLSHPGHLAIDGSGRILVVDGRNERIIRLDRNLCLVEVLRCPGNENGPVRLFCEAARFLIGTGDAIYVYSIDFDDHRSSQADAPERDSGESDSDDDTDDVKPLMRSERNQPLLEKQFSRPMQTFSPINDQSFFGDRGKLRQRKLESNL